MKRQGPFVGVYYAAVVARSYAGNVGLQDRVRVDGWTYDPEYLLRSGDKVLLVDDIFDTAEGP